MTDEQYIIEYKRGYELVNDNTTRTLTLFDIAKRCNLGNLNVGNCKASSPENLALRFAIDSRFSPCFVDEVSELEFVVSCQRAEEVLH